MDQSIESCYETIRLGKNPICLACKQNHGGSKALGMWHVGNNFSGNPLKILFVGKPHRDEPYNAVENSDFPDVLNGIIASTNFEYCLAENCATALFMRKSWPYWSYTREFTSKLFGSPERAWDNIAMTNIVKCTVSKGTDRTSKPMKQSCISDLGVIWKEIITLNPRHVTFYLGRNYDSYIEEPIIKRFFPDGRIDEVTNRNYYVNVGRKKCWWWHRNLILANGDVIKFLRVSHPERMNKKDYINHLYSWITDTTI